MDKLKIVRKILPIFGIVILVIFLFSLDRQAFLEAMKTVSLSLVVVILGLTSLNILLKGWRWKLLIRGVTDQIISLPFSFASIIMGVAAGSFIPGKVEMAKPLLLKTGQQIPFSKSLSALFIERIFDFLVIAGLLLLSVAFLPPQKIVSTTLLVFFAAILSLFLLGVVFFPQVYVTPLRKLTSVFLPKRWSEKLYLFLDHFFESFAIFKQKKQLILLLIISILANCLEVFRLYYILQFFSIKATFIMTSFALALAVVVGILSLIPGGMGITELTTAGVIGLLLHNTNDLIKSAVLLDRIFAYYLLIITGAILLIVYKKKLQPVSEEKSI